MNPAWHEILECPHALASTGREWSWSASTLAEVLAEIGDDWHRLAITTRAPLMALPMWYVSLYEAFGDMTDALQVHCLYSGSRLVAVLPLSLDRGLFRTWRIYQHPWYTPFSALAVDSQCAGVGPEIRRHLLNGADVLDFRWVQAESRCVVSLLEGVEPSRVIIESDDEKADVYHPVNESWEDCLGHASKGLLKKIRKAIRRLERKGTLKMSVVTESLSIEAALTECLELEKSGWKGRNGTAIGCMPSAEKFYRGLFRRAAEAGFCSFYMLRLGERLIAFDLCVSLSDRIESLKIGYDETFSRESPGSVLTYMILERECARKVFAGFHRGDPTAAKARWAGKSNSLTRILVFGDSLRGRCSRQAYVHIRPLIRRIHQASRRVNCDQNGE